MIASAPNRLSERCWGRQRIPITGHRRQAPQAAEKAATFTRDAKLSTAASQMTATCAPFQWAAASASGVDTTAARRTGAGAVRAHTALVAFYQTTVGARGYCMLNVNYPR